MSKLTEEERRLIEMGEHHIAYEQSHEFRPDPMVLFGEVEKLFRIFIRNREENLRESRRLILLYLERHDGCMQQDLVNFTHMSAPSVSLEITEMEKDGLLKKKKSEKDARATGIFVTGKGKERTARDKAWFEDRSRELLTVFTSEERENFVSMLCRLREALIERMKNES